AYIAALTDETIVFSTSFGLEDQVLTHLIAALQLPVKLFTLDTGRLFQETYDVFERTRARYKLAVDVFFPDKTELELFVNENGVNSFYQSVEQRKMCCQIRKVEPLNRALRGASVGITGLRSGQSETRGELKFWELDPARGILKFNPLLDFTLEQTEAYAKEHRIPLNALHAKGFPSIGCAPCTRAIEPGEGLRAGRWWWENSKKECGLHSA
ncbi:MAG: phosphoadenylyl-sulfate reductase, partial [Bacteroidia bacterium]